MKNFIIITAFSRPHNMPVLLEMWKDAVEPKDATRWMLMSAEKKNPSPDWWIWEADCHPPLPVWDACYFKLNEAISRLENCGVLSKDVWIGFLPDDDSYDKDFFLHVHAVAHEENSEVIVVSARRHPGSFDPNAGILKSDPEQMVRCKVGLEQFFVRGDILRQVPRFDNISCADGIMVERLFARNKDGFRYLPDVFVNWNIFPPNPRA